jgi:anaerobic selenocysteine-containing dehydrogenase
MMAEKLEPRGVTLERLEQATVRSPVAPKIVFEGRRFPTASGRVNLITEAPPIGPTMLDDAEYPLTLLSLSTDESQSSQWSVTHEGPAIATIHPAAAPGLTDGAVCTLSSRVGTMRVRLRFDDHQRKDVVLVPKGGHHRSGKNPNALLSARLTDAGEGGALYDQRVRLGTRS